jgi:anaerobic nitric oxide reductase transcription regulator
MMPAQEEGEIIGQSRPLRELLHEMQVVADSELPVLLLGETGVGKELFARRLHRLSRRLWQAAGACELCGAAGVAGGK